MRTMFTRLIGSGFLLAGLPLTAFAVDTQYAVEAGAANSDNILRTNANERDDTTLTAAAEFSLLQDGRRFDANVAGLVAYQDYVHNSFDGEFLGAVNASASAAIVPERFNWVALENYGQTIQDPFAADTPENREYVNYFTTGPDIFFGLGRSTRLGFGGRYSLVEYQDSPTDNHRFGAAASLTSQLSRGSEAALIVQQEGVRFSEGSSATDFDRDAAFLRYSLAGSRTRFEVDAGYNRVTLLEEETGGPMVRASVTRELGRFSAITVSGGHELTESGNTLRLQQSSGNLSLDTLSLPSTPNPYTLDRLTLDLSAGGRRTRLGVTISGYRESFDGQPENDRDRLYFSSQIARDVGSRVAAHVGFQYQDTRLRNSAQEAKDLSWTAGLNWNIQTQLYLDFAASWTDRTDPLAINSYKETRFSIRLRRGGNIVRGVGAFGSR